MKILPKNKFDYTIYPIKNKDGEYLEGVIEITDEEYSLLKKRELCFNDELTGLIPYVKPEPVVRDTPNKRKAELKKILRTISEDIVQELIGAVIPDIDNKKEQFISAHTELRELEGKSPRLYE